MADFHNKDFIVTYSCLLVSRKLPGKIVTPPHRQSSSARPWMLLEPSQQQHLWNTHGGHIDSQPTSFSNPSLPWMDSTTLHRVPSSSCPPPCQDAEDMWTAA